MIFNRKKAVFERLVQAYSAELYRYAYWLCRERFAAEDLVQETFTRAWSGWTSLRDEHAAKKWLYTILRNENARRFARERPDLSRDQDLDAIEDRAHGNMYDELEMREALHALPAPYREPLLLQVLGGFSCDEIAKALYLTPGAVMTRLCRARAMLRKSARVASDKKEASA